MVVILVILIGALIYFIRLPHGERVEVMKTLRSSLPKAVDKAVECTPIVDNGLVTDNKNLIYQWKDDKGVIHYGDSPPATLESKDITDKYPQKNIGCPKNKKQ